MKATKNARQREASEENKFNFETTESRAYILSEAMKEERKSNVEMVLKSISDLKWGIDIVSTENLYVLKNLSQEDNRNYFENKITDKIKETLSLTEKIEKLLVEILDLIK